MAAISQNRGRRLAFLGGAALAVAVLAGAALYQRAIDAGPSFEAQPVVPGLSDTINNVGEITIETRDGTFHARRTEDGNWVIPERNNFPANIQMVRSASVGMAELEAIEPRTSQPELLARLGLGDPADGGEAIRVIVSNRAGEVMGDILIGNQQGIADPQGLARFYVRRTGQNQSWLARGSMTVQRDVAGWLDKKLFSVERDDIKSAHFSQPGGTDYTLSRENEEATNYSLDPIPAGRELSYAGVTYAPATAIANFSFSDVRPISEVDFTDAAEVTSETFAGLQIMVRVVELNGTHWASLIANSTAEGDAQLTADGINVAAHGWAFEIPEFTAQSFLTTRDSLLAPAGG
jgi:hypothetical protein